MYYEGCVITELLECSTFWSALLGQTADVCTGRSIEECEMWNLGTTSEFVLGPTVYTDNTHQFGWSQDLRDA